MTAYSSVKGQAARTSQWSQGRERGDPVGLSPRGRHDLLHSSWGFAAALPYASPPGAPEGPVVWSPRPALRVDVRAPGPERSGLWGECQVGGGGNSNQIRHTALRPCPASCGGESKGRRKQERFEARELPLTLLLLCLSGKRSPFKLCWGKPSCPARVQPDGRALTAGRAG